MGAKQQGANLTTNRWITIPRTLIFVRNGNDILLMKRAAHKRIFPNQYNGLDGHIERDEDPLTGAKREVLEESGLSLSKISLRAIYNVDAGQDSGILLFVYLAESTSREITQYIMDQLRASRDADGYLGFWNVEANNYQNVVNWILHEQEYVNLALVRIYRTTGNPQSLADARVMADYIMRSFPANPQGEHLISAGTSIAGITEGFVELYRVTGDAKYLAFARNLQYESHWYYLKPFEAWQKNFAKARYHVYVMLSDMYPDTELYRLIRRRRLRQEEPVDETGIVRTYFISDVNGRNSILINL